MISGRIDCPHCGKIHGLNWNCEMDRLLRWRRFALVLIGYSAAATLELVWRVFT